MNSVRRHADRAGQPLPARRIAGRVKTWHTGRTIVANQPDSADATHRAFATQGHRPTFGKWIDERAIERQEAIGLRLPQPTPLLRRGLVVLGEYRAFEQCLGNRGVAPLIWVSICEPSSRVKDAHANGRPLFSGLGFGAHVYGAENSIPDSTAPASAAIR